jgi:uncharacterized protein (DUF2147 family)
MRALIASFCLLAGVASASASADGPYGLWARGDGIARVKIEPCGSHLCAINTWIKPGISDEKVGDKLVLSIKADNARHWEGEAFDPKRNLRFNMSFDVDNTSMQSRGCVLGGLVCRSTSWTRLSQD